MGQVTRSSAFSHSAMLARIATAARYSARPVQLALSPGAKVLRPALFPATVSARGFAATVSAPKPLSIRMDSLFVKCVVAALVYFVPQDAVFLGGLGYYWYKAGRTAAPKQRQ